MMNARDIPIEQIKKSMRETWMAGDFGVVARTIATGAGEFINRIAIPSGAAVLDVACGTGNLAIPLARAGAVVTGVDIASNLIVQARERAVSEGLVVRFDEGDAEALPYPDAQFDAVVSMFGAMFAPRPELTAAEMSRVLKPGGLLAMANWNPSSFTAKMFQLGSRYVPPPPGLAAPVLWGDGATVRDRLCPYFRDIETELVPIDFDMAMNPAGAVAFFRQYFGPTRMAFGRLDEAGQSAFAADLESLWASANASGESDRTLVHNQYLMVKARRLELS